MDILISGGIVITMDPHRSIMGEGAVAIEDDRIVEVDGRKKLIAKHHPRKFIKASRKLVVPGLFDGHGHASNGLARNMRFHPF